MVRCGGRLTFVVKEELVVALGGRVLAVELAEGDSVLVGQSVAALLILDHCWVLGCAQQPVVTFRKVRHRNFNISIGCQGERLN